VLGAPTLAAATTGTSAISGHVTDASSGEGLEGISVSSYKADGSGSWYLARSGNTDTHGDYDFEALLAGTYKVKFEDSSGQHAVQYHKGKTTIDAADEITVGEDETASDIDASLVAPSHIAGTVTDAASGAPLEGVRVELFHQDGPCACWNTGMTDADGSYDIGGLAAGHYQVSFVDQSGAHVIQYFDGAAAASDARDVEVGDDETVSHIDAALIEASYITGHVTDAMTHAPVVTAVEVWVSDGLGGWDWLDYTYTATDGSYSIAGLAAGVYRVKFLEARDYFGQCYNGKTTLDVADDIKVGDAETVSGIDAKLVSYIWSVYRFRNLKNGYYLWTASEAEKNNIVATMSKTWKLEGVAYRIHTRINTSPLWRFRNLKSGFYLYTSDANEKNSIVANLSKSYKLEGVAYNVSRTTGSPVWRFRNLKDGTYLYSADPNEKANIVAKLYKTWKLEGVAYLIASYSPTPD
jgi:5-hydroxyisourate hydrolase-like protein (transthyretin family)